MDGFLPNEKSILVITTTNNPELVDDALKRTGRFDFTINIPLPNEVERVQIFKLYLGNKPKELG